MQIYVDVLFLINFSTDYLTLYLTGCVFHYSRSRARCVIASVILAFYGLWALLLCRSYVLLIISCFLSALGGNLFCYRLYHPRRLFSATFVFLGIGALLGSLVLLLYRFLSRILPGRELPRDSGSKVLVFTILCAVSAVLIYIGNRILCDVRGSKSARVTISFCGRTVTETLLVDSGNLLRDPISGRRVILVSVPLACKLFGPDWRRQDVHPTRRRLIPAETAAGKQTLIAFLPDDVHLGTRQIEALVAVGGQQDFHGYPGLYPSSLLSGGHAI